LKEKYLGGEKAEKQMANYISSHHMRSENG